MNKLLSRGTFVHRLLLSLVAATCWAAAADAHEVRPAYLELRETAPDTFNVLWKVPARGEYRLSLHVLLPRECSGAPQHGTFTGGAFVEQWQAICEGGLVGRTIAIEGLSATRTDVLARVERVDGTTQTVRLTPEQTSFEVTAAPTALEVAQTYFLLGVEHILLGIDHLLFVLGLLFLVGNWKQLVGTVTAFTIAHSITLAAATLGWVHVPPPPVEATIALSIVFLATEIMHARAGRPGLTYRRPWIVAFLFGLLHGLGFAGALSEVGLPAHAIPTALLFFNAGVEIGQLSFIAAVLGLLACARQVPLPRGNWSWKVPVYAIGATASFWTIDRVVGF